MLLRLLFLFFMRVISNNFRTFIKIICIYLNSTLSEFPLFHIIKLTKKIKQIYFKHSRNHKLLILLTKRRNFNIFLLLRSNSFLRLCSRRITKRRTVSILFIYLTLCLRGAWILMQYFLQNFSSWFPMSAVLALSISLHWLHEIFKELISKEYDYTHTHTHDNMMIYKIILYQTYLTDWLISSPYHLLRFDKIDCVSSWLFGTTPPLTENIDYLRWEEEEPMISCSFFIN